MMVVRKKKYSFAERQPDGKWFVHTGDETFGSIWEWANGCVPTREEHEEYIRSERWLNGEDVNKYAQEVGGELDGWSDPISQQSGGPIRIEVEDIRELILDLTDEARSFCIQVTQWRHVTKCEGKTEHRYETSWMVHICGPHQIHISAPTREALYFLLRAELRADRDDSMEAAEDLVSPISTKEEA